MVELVYKFDEKSYCFEEVTLLRQYGSRTTISNLPPATMFRKLRKFTPCSKVRLVYCSQNGNVVSNRIHVTSYRMTRREQLKILRTDDSTAERLSFDY